MTPDEFAALLDRYGGDLSHWPDQLRAGAEALLAQGPGEAWKQYRVAQVVEAALSSKPEAPDQALLNRILARAHTTPAERQITLAVAFSGWQRGLAAASVFMSLAAGLLAGWSNQTTYDVYINADIPGLTSSPGDWEVGD